MKITKLLITEFKGQLYSSPDKGIISLEDKGYEYVSHSVTMAATGDNSLIGAQGIIIIVMQKDKI